MLYPDISNITIDNIQLPELENKNILLDVLRLDKIHPVISGNKWFKLKYHLENFHRGNFKGIVTFGGAWSNHIIATAYVCQLHKIGSVGIIRGEEPGLLSKTLADAKNYTMELEFVSREEYRKKDSLEFLNKLKEKYSGYYIIPEGGAGAEGEKGVEEILDIIPKNKYTHIVCAIGTGTMFKGLSNAAKRPIKMIGVPVLKGWKEEVQIDNGEFIPDYHFGGYAKYNPILIDFMNYFYSHTKIPTDIVYTAKLAYGIIDLVKKNYFMEGSKILMIHSGGSQGNNSLEKGSLIF